MLSGTCICRSGRPRRCPHGRSRGAPTAQSQSRPIILNRPFRSVAELGYVFSGNPWKNVDFSTPESGYSELLDVFCVNDTNPPAGLVAGTVNVNTRQPAVLNSVLAGAYTDEENAFSPSPAWSTSPLAASDANAISQLLVARTSTAPLAGPNVSAGPQPLENIGDLVGRWNNLQAPPTDVDLTNYSVAENQPAATVVGSLGGVGPHPSSTYTYALVSGTGSDDKASFSVANNLLQTGASFQYLNKSSYSVRLRVIDQDSLSFEKPVTISVLPSAYTQWKIANFAGKANDPTVAGDLVDADHHGTVNLVEYALGMSPLTADVPGISLQQDANGIEFNYTRLSAATDVTVHVYWTSDLTNPGSWSTTGITETMLTDDGTLQRWQATLPRRSSQNAFLRLQVTKP